MGSAYGIDYYKIHSLLLLTLFLGKSHISTNLVNKIRLFADDNLLMLLLILIELEFWILTSVKTVGC